MQVQQKSKLVTLLLCWFLGTFGVHRFYTGKIGTGILYLLTGGLCGFGIIVDLIMLLCNSFKDKNNIPLNNDVPTFVIVIGLIVWLVLIFVFNVFGFIGNIISGIFFG